MKRIISIAVLAAAALLGAQAAFGQTWGSLWDGKIVPGFASNGLTVGAVTYSGTSGTGNLVGGTSPTLTTPTLTTPTMTSPVLGAASATSLTFTSTSGVIGTTTNDSAAAGSVGELLSTTVAVGSHVALSTGATSNMTSVSLTAGDWDVTCNVVHELAGTTTVTILSAGLSTTTATVPTIGLTDSAYFRQASAAPGGAITQTVGPHRVSLASTTTLFCAANDTFGTSTDFVYGVIRARRVR